MGCIRDRHLFKCTEIVGLGMVYDKGTTIVQYCKILYRTKSYNGQWPMFLLNAG